MYVVDYIGWQELMAELPGYWGAYYGQVTTPGAIPHISSVFVTGNFNYTYQEDVNGNVIPYLYEFTPPIAQTEPPSDLVLLIVAQDLALNTVAVSATDVTEGSFKITGAGDCMVSFILSLKTTE